jgi:hypothetical protein
MAWLLQQDLWGMRMSKPIKALFYCLIILAVQHCAQSRRGNTPEKEKEIWAAYEMCEYNTNDQPIRCMAVEPNITDNQAIVEVRLIDFNPGKVPYRILARPAGESLYDVLANNVTVPQGSSITVKPVGKRYIEEYEEWVMETTQNKSANGLNIQTVSPGSGVVLIQEFANYPELSILK